MSKLKEISSGDVVSSVKSVTFNGSTNSIAVKLLEFISSIVVSSTDRKVVLAEMANVYSLRISSESVLEKVRLSIVESSIVRKPPVSV